jgi:acetolactate synthase I/III small subunit
MRRIISMLLQNEAGALARVAGLFAARGYNIDTLTVAPTHDTAMSRLTLVTHGDETVIDQIIKQSRKLVDVIDIADLTSRAHLECELLIVKVNVAGGRASLVAACVRRHPRASLFDEGESVRTIQFTGSGAEVDAFLAELSSTTRVVEMARSGTAALDCGELVLEASA